MGALHRTAFVAVAIAAGIAAALATEARADPIAPTAPIFASTPRVRATYSPYERESIARALAKVGGSIDPSPQGKVLEDVDVVALDVFEDRDPLPGFLIPIANFFHATSRRYVIAQEVLVSPGERYDQARVDESARNLRGIEQLSLVLCVPLVGSAPDRVRLLVITKDVWSLRLNSDFRFANGRLQTLVLQPSEINLLGTHQEVFGNFALDTASLALGASYVLPRLAGSHINANASANVVLNRETHKAEGSYGSLSYGQPLYSTRTLWAWGGAMAWDNRVVRRLIGGEITDYDPSQGKCALPAKEVSMAEDHQRCQYTRDNQSGSFAVTRSFGSSIKHNVTVGIGASRRVYHTLDLSGLGAADQQAYTTTYVPVSDTANGPFVEYHTYENSYFDVLDLDTLSLTESYQRGHDVTVRLTPFTRALRSSRDHVDVSVAAAYTWKLGDGLVRVGAGADTALTTHGVPDGSVNAALRIATPRFGHGRLVFDARLLERYANYLNLKSTLGDDSRLRGYPAAQFIGSNLVEAGLEYRSDPLSIASVQLGWVIFAEAGDAFDSLATFRLKQSCGAGIRAAFPQAQRSVLRLDLAFPLTLGVLPASQYHADFIVTFGQAF